jgi:hypothetical protein
MTRHKSFMASGLVVDRGMADDRDVLPVNASQDQWVLIVQVPFAAGLGFSLNHRRFDRCRSCGGT